MKEQPIGPYSKLMNIQNNRVSDNTTTRQHDNVLVAKHDNSTTSQHVVKPTHNKTNKPVAIQTNLPTAKPTNLIEDIRVAVKDSGNEWSGYRFTESEKEALYDLRHSLRKFGYKNVSDNLIVRIALNNLVGDYQTNKKDSTLVAVLERLNS